LGYLLTEAKVTRYTAREVSVPGGFAITLVDPVPADRVTEVAAKLSAATGGDKGRIVALLKKGGVLARAETRARAEQIAATLGAAGLAVQIVEPQAEFTWNTPAEPATNTPPGTSAPAVPKAAAGQPGRGTANPALVAAAVCLILGGLIAYYVPFLLIVFGPLFVAAFALSIVAMAQGKIAGGTIVLIASLVVGPIFTIGGIARFFTGPTSTTSTATEPTTTDRVSPEVDRTPVAPLAQRDLDEIEYRSSVALYDLEARRVSTFLRDETTGVRFKLRNDGVRTVRRLQVTVYFRDANNVVVFQERFTPVTDSTLAFDSDVLRPNHIFQMPSDRYFTVDRVPDEWQEGNVIAEITSLELE
jgi:hypothetical protein